MSIYLVSGFMRSGTSMMMRALQAGGLEAVYNPDRDKMNVQHGDEHYKVNDDGFYELSRAEYANPEFPDCYDGKLVKCLWGGMPLLRASDTMKYICFMRRPLAEIANSYEAAFGAPHPQAIPELDAKLDRIQGILKQRRDVTLTVLQYHDVLRQPLQSFRNLRLDGWPIEPQYAAATVDPDKHRHRAA